MPRILKNIRIDEVSVCTKGAGEGTRVVLMKRDDSDDGDIYSSQWYKEQAAIAERMNAEHVRKHARPWRLFNEVLAENVAKSYAATARGDEADMRDEKTSADELVDGGNDHHASKVADLLVESGKHPNRAAALDHLLHTAQGAAMLRRLHKSEDTNIMNPTDKLRDIAKRYGIGAIAKSIVEDDHGYSIDEHELTSLVVECAKRDNPNLTDAQAFARVYSAQDEGGIMLRKAFNVVKSAASVDGAYPFPKF